ncbi:hypothetical protein NLI96_g5464 [Meripilus lineatus]|uniref:Uncharacterized protein n=1 Tax=Meripilus lineatus TaxID=2056292 RepID=A0AAD5V2U2_9APHY|nr:hypothetical protein NLI96_g5464 [Physisporinus lineatus]
MQRLRKLSNLFKRGGSHKDPPLDPPDADPQYDHVPDEYADLIRPMYVHRGDDSRSQRPKPAKLKKASHSSTKPPTEDQPKFKFPTRNGKPIQAEDMKAHVYHVKLHDINPPRTSSSECGSSESHRELVQRDKLFPVTTTVPLRRMDVRPSQDPSLFLNRRLNNYQPHSSTRDNTEPTSGGTLPRTRRPQADPRAMGFASADKKFEPNRGPPHQPFLLRPVAKSDAKPPAEVKRQLGVKRAAPSTNMMYNVKDARATASLGNIPHSNPVSTFPQYPPPLDPRSRAQPQVKEVRGRTRSQTGEPLVSSSPPRPTEEKYITYSRVATALSTDRSLPPVKSVVASQEVTVKPSNRGRVSCQAEVLNNDAHRSYAAEVVPPLPLKSALVRRTPKANVVVEQRHEFSQAKVDQLYP